MFYNTFFILSVSLLWINWGAYIQQQEEPWRRFLLRSRKENNLNNLNNLIPGPVDGGFFFAAGCQSAVSKGMASTRSFSAQPSARASEMWRKAAV